MIRPRKLTNGKLVYDVRVGEGSKKRTFPTRKQAEKWEGEERRRRADERAGLEPDLDPITYDALCDLYFATRGVESPWLKSMLTYSRDRFGDHHVHLLRGTQIGPWLHSLTSIKKGRTGKPLAPKTKQHILDAMRQVMGYAVDEGYLRRSPVRPKAVSVKGGNRPPTVNPFQSWDEVDRVAGAAIRTIDSALILFIAATGLRPEEALALRWDRLKLEEGSGNVLTVVVDGVELDAGKTPGALRPFVMTRRAIDALELLPEPLRKSQLVFPNTKGGFVDLDNWRARVWHPAVKLSGLTRRPLYQLRHTFATLALEDGVPIELVSAQLGHTDIRTTLRFYAKYRKPSHDRLRAILDEAHKRKDTNDHRDKAEQG
jgi:integrase